MKKTVALILTVCLLAGVCLTGCSPKNEYIAKVNGKEVPVGWYLSNAVYTAAQLEHTYGKEHYLTFLTEKNSTDPEKTNAQVLDEAAKTAFESNYAYKLFVEELGLELDDMGKEALDEEYNFYKSYFYNSATFDDFLKMSGVTEQQHKEIYMASTYYPDMIYDYYFDEEVGIDPFTEADIKAFFDEYTEYAMQHILFTYATTDAKGDPLDDKTIAENKAAAKKEAEDTLKKIEAGELVFTDAMNTMSDDSSLSTYPNGYAWAEGGGLLPEIFTTAAKEMDYGDIKIYESEMGFHIMREMDPADYLSDNYKVYETAYTKYYIEDKVNEFKMNHMFVEYNEKVLAKHKFINIGSTGIQLLSLT